MRNTDDIPTVMIENEIQSEKELFSLLQVLNEAYTYFMFLLNFVSDSSGGR
jgi:hypothetical protein